MKKNKYIIFLNQKVNKLKKYTTRKSKKDKCTIEIRYQDYAETNWNQGRSTVDASKCIHEQILSINVF